MMDDRSLFKRCYVYISYSSHSSELVEHTPTVHYKCSLEKWHLLSFLNRLFRERKIKRIVANKLKVET